MLPTGAAIVATTAQESAWVDPDAVPLPVIMYHSLLKTRRNKYIVSPDEFEKDLQYIKEKGYQTVTIQDVADFVYDSKPLPEKPIMITFDDGYYNNMVYALPLLEKYDMKMVLSIVGDFTDNISMKDPGNPNYSYLTWDQVKTLHESGRVEIQNHSYGFHRDNAGRTGSMKKKSESEEQYRIALTEDLGKMQEKTKQHLGVEPICYTYPFGAVSRASFDIIKDMKFKATMSCREAMNYLTHDPECLQLIKRYNRPSGKNSEAFFKKVLR